MGPAWFNARSVRARLQARKNLAPCSQAAVSGRHDIRSVPPGIRECFRRPVDHVCTGCTLKIGRVGEGLDLPARGGDTQRWHRAWRAPYRLLKAAGNNPENRIAGALCRFATHLPLHPLVKSVGARWGKNKVLFGGRRPSIRRASAVNTPRERGNHRCICAGNRLNLFAG